MTCRTLIACLFIGTLWMGNALASNACESDGVLIDQRSTDQRAADAEKGRLRCVEFVLSTTGSGAAYGWVAWHNERSRQSTSTHRVGLFPTQQSRAMAFGRVPEQLQKDGSALTVTVLLPTHRWWLVNTTRHGWQLRSGTVSNPGIDTLRKLFTDVAINAGLAEETLRFEHWWPGGSSNGQG